MNDTKSMTAAKVILKPGKERILYQGHPWLFSGAIATADRGIAPGQVVRLFSHAGTGLATAFYNPKSDIALRVIAREADAEINHAFWQRRIEAAVTRRARMLPPDTNACRLINAEGDGMPGLIVDRYDDFLVTSFSTAGMEAWRECVHSALRTLLTPRGIYERSEGRSRAREGFEERCMVAWGAAPPAMLEIIEHGARFLVNLREGQKTGFFLDQRENRRLVGTVCRAAAVLNCFAYSGGFSVHAARTGAERVVSIDSSAAANELCRQNMGLNGFSSSQHPVVAANVFDFLRDQDELFDVIILDPPAFAKSQKEVMAAARGYKEINLQALKRLRPGGFLATFSCSNHVDGALFHKIVIAAAADAGKTAQLLCEMGAGPDHPVILAHSEGRYLKGLLLGIE